MEGALDPHRDFPFPLVHTVHSSELESNCVDAHWLMEGASDPHRDFPFFLVRTMRSSSSESDSLMDSFSEVFSDFTLRARAAHSSGFKRGRHFFFFFLSSINVHLGTESPT